MEKNNNDLFELITKMYSEMQDIKNNMSTKDDLARVESKVDNLETKVDKLSIKVEQDLEPKIQVLFDGYSTHTEQLTRIEDEVARHDEVIIRRVK